MAYNNDIWNCTKEVWGTIPNENIGRSFVQYGRTLSKMIKAKGSNAFLVYGGTMHCIFSKNFNPTENGVVPVNK